MNDQFFENNEYKEDPNVPGYRKVFSRVGFACLVTLGLNFAISLFVSRYVAPEFPVMYDSGKIWYWIYQIAVQYVICIPLGILVLSLGPGRSENAPKAKLEPSTPLIAAAISFAFIVAGNFLGSLLNALTESIAGVSSVPQDPGVKNALSAVMYFLVVVVLAPLMEELFFRKKLIDAMGPFGEKTAVIMSALIFGIAHHNVGQFVYAFIVGIVFGFIYMRTGKLRYTVMIHMAVNLICGYLPEFAMGILMDPEVYERFAAEAAQMQDVLFASLVEGGTELFAQLRAFYLDFYSILPGYMVLSFSQMVSYGMAIAGMMLFLTFRRRLSWRQGELPLRKEDKGYVIFLAPGMLAYFILGLSMIALSYFWY